MTDAKEQSASAPEAARRELAARHAARRTQATIDVDVTKAAAEAVAQGTAEDPLGISASYHTLRRGLAILAFALPVVLLAGGVLSAGGGLEAIQGSLSAYYHFTAKVCDEYGSGSMRNVFVGVLYAVGVFLLLYRGYSRGEDIALNVAGVAAVLVAMFPMDWPVVPENWPVDCVKDGTAAVARTLTGKIHAASAATFFLAIAYVCIFRSNDTLSILSNEQSKIKFKRIYAALGAWMIATPIIILVLRFSLDNPAYSYWILGIEISGIYIFSIFWIFKSREIIEIERE